MSDGTTGIQVAPIQESEDMGNIRTAFDKALNAIVQASALAKQVEELASKVNALSHDVDTLRQRNAWLDEQLTSVRQTRDQALSDLSHAKAEVARVQADHEALTTQTQNQNETITDLKAENEALRKERDDHGMRAMELEDQLSKASATIAKVQALFPAQPVPEPPVVVPFTLPTTGAATPSQDYQEPEPKAEPYNPSRW